MKKQLTLLTLGLIGIFGVSALAIASVPNEFFIKEKKMQVQIVHGGDYITLPSTIGKTGHVYIFITDNLDMAFQTTAGDLINNLEASSTDIINCGGQRRAVFVGDEENRSWWTMSCN